MIDRHLSLADRFDALIFDCDGTLVDSMPAHFEAWTRALTRVGITFTEQRFYELGGVTPVRIIETLAREANIELDLARVEAERDEHFRQLSDEITGVAPVVDIARRHRGLLPMAVATGSCHASAEHSLAQLGIMRWFDTVVCAEDVARGKPAPDVFLEAARRMGVSPSRCCAYEDTDLGLRAIRNAGMAAVDIRMLRP